MSYELKWEKEGVVNTITNIHSLLEDSDAVTELFDDERSHHIKYIIWDLSKVHETTMKEVQTNYHAQIVESHVRTKSPLKVVFVTENEEMKELCISYIHHAVANGSIWRFNVKGTIEEARNWINLD